MEEYASLSGTSIVFEMLVLISGDKPRKKPVFYCDCFAALSALIANVTNFRLNNLIKKYANRK